MSTFLELEPGPGNQRIKAKLFAASRPDGDFVDVTKSTFPQGVSDWSQVLGWDYNKQGEVFIKPPPRAARPTLEQKVDILNAKFDLMLAKQGVKQAAIDDITGGGF